MGLGALMLLAFGLRLYRLELQNIWWDEARNIDVALRPFWQIPTAPELDIHPPLYFELLHGWLAWLGIRREMAWPVVAYGARFLSAAVGTVGVALLARWGRQVGGWRLAGLVACLGAVSPLWVAEAQEARMYTLAFAWLLAAALAFHALQRETRADSGWGRAHLAFGVALALALATHYTVLFVAVAWYGFWTLQALRGPRRGVQIRHVGYTGLVTAGLLLPVVPIALRQIPDYANPNLGIPSWSEYLAANWSGFLGGYAWHSEWLSWLRAKGWWLWTMFGMALVGLAAAWSHGRSLQEASTPASQAPGVPGPRDVGIADIEKGTGFALVWLVGGLALYYGAVVDRGAFNIRYSSFVTPALYLLLGVGLVGLRRWHGLAPWLGLGLVLVGMVPALRADLSDPRFFREDMAGVAAWLRERVQPQDAIFVDQKYPFGFYWRRYAIPPGEIREGPEPAPARYLFVDINTVDRKLSAWAGQARRVFWVEWYESDTDPRGAVAFLLDKHGRRQGKQEFRGYRVTWWELEPPTRFVLAQGMRAQELLWENGMAAVEVGIGPLRSEGRTQIPVVVRWRRWAEPPARPWKARVALYDDQGTRLAQDDRRLLNDRHLAPREWEAQDRPLNVYMLALESELPPGRYPVRLLVYDGETLEPVTWVDGAGSPRGIEPVIGWVER